MTQQSIYISDQGELLLIDAPDKSQYIIDDDGIERYEAALASAIKLGIKFKDQQEVLSLLYNAGQFDKFTRKELKGKIFPLPTGYKVSFECCGKGGQIGNSKAGFHCDRSGCIHKLAILSKLEERSEEIKNCKVLDRIKFKGNIDICANDLESVVAPSEEVKLRQNFETVLPFMMWYSGMEEKKIRAAHERYLKECFNKILE